MGKKEENIKETFADIFFRKTRAALSALIDLAACVYLVFMIVALPLYNHGDYSHIGSEKVAFLWAFCKPFTIGIFIVGGLYILQNLADRCRKNGWKPGLPQRRFGNAFSVTDGFVAVYGIIVMVSYFFSDYKEQAWLGKSSWGMGAFIQITFVASYFCISRVWKQRKWMLFLAFPVTLILFVLGYFNRFGVYPIPMKLSENAAFISLVGNINWYCGYMVMPVFAGTCFAWSMRFSNKRSFFFMAAYLLVSFGALVTNGSSSGIVAMLGVFLILFFLSVPEGKSMLSFGATVLTAMAACIFTLLLRSLFPGRFTYPEMTVNLLTKSVLPFVGFVVTAVLMLLLRTWQKRGNYPARIMKKLGKVFLIALMAGGVLFLALIVVNTLFPGSIGPLSKIPVFTFSDSWGSMRGATWKAGAWLWWELDPWKKLIGIGSDVMDLHIQNGASEALRNYVNGIWPNLALTNAHCEPLTVMVQYGVFGLAAFEGLLVTSIVRYLRQLEFGEWRSCLVASCGMAIASYAINNLFSFQQVMNGPALFVILGIGESFYRTKAGWERSLQPEM